METMERKKPRPRRSFTPEFKAEIVELCRRGDRSIGQVARDFDLTETNVRTWVKQAEIDQGERPGLTTEERVELTKLRRENRSLREDVEILKRATAFFAQGDPVKVDPFIEAEKAAGHNVAKACDLLEVSKSAYYERRGGVPSARSSPMPSCRQDRRRPRRVQGHLWRPADPPGAPASTGGLREAQGDQAHAPGRPRGPVQEALAQDHRRRPRRRGGQGSHPAPLRAVR